MLLCAVGFTACSSDADDVIEENGIGYVSLALSADTGFGNATKAVDEGKYEDVNNYTVQILNSEEVKAEFLYSDSSEELPITLKNGTYTLKAFYGKETDASRDVFYVEGSKSFIVESNSQTLEVSCKPTCAKLNVNFASDMETYFSEYFVTYETEASKSSNVPISWNKNDTEPWYIKVNDKGENVKAIISVTRKSDNKTATIEKSYNMTAGKSWTLNISPNNNEGSLGISITIDESTNDHNVDITVPSDWI